MLPLTAELQSFLEHPDRPEGTLKYPELQGFLFAVANAPEEVGPTEWIPAVFDMEEVEFKNLEEAQTISSALIEEFNAVNDASLAGRMPPGCVLRDEPMANLEDDAPIAAWARGFARGYGWLEETWGEYLPGAGPHDNPEDQDLEEEFGAVLMVLTFFASPGVAEGLAGEVGKSDMEELATQMHLSFADAVAQYVNIGRSIQEYTDEAAHTPYQRETPKVGRNDPCPCGSGRKYKKCCGEAGRVH
jgi:uncharacterized protein